MATMTKSPWQSERLIYRPPEQPDDEGFFLSIQSDPFGFQNSNAALAAPQGKASAKNYLQYVAEKTLLGVVICLPSPDGKTPPVPIGCVHLSRLSQHNSHHRYADLGIDIVPPYQGQGYGSEAIRWTTRWAFQTAGLHRVNIRAFAYNSGAVKLYEHLGFQREGISRELIWHDGRWWDDIQFGMLETEWREANK